MDSVIILRSYWESIYHLPQETRGKFLEAYIRYGLDGIEPKFDGLEKSLWISIKSSMEANMKRYKASVENGKKGGAPKGNNNAKKQLKTTQEQPKITENNLNKNKDKDKNMDIDKDMDIDKELDRILEMKNIR